LAVLVEGYAPPPHDIAAVGALVLLGAPPFVAPAPLFATGAAAATLPARLPCCFSPVPYYTLMRAMLRRHCCHELVSLLRQHAAATLRCRADAHTPA